MSAFLRRKTKVLNTEMNQIEEEAEEEVDENYTLRLLSNILYQEKYGDVKFGFVFDEEIVFAHKAILASKCRYFDDLFSKKDYKDTNTPIVMDWSAAAFKILLRFIYTGIIDETSLSEDNIIDLFRLCSRIHYNPLLPLITQLFSQIEITVYNVSKIFNVYSEVGNIEMVSKCLHILDWNASKVVKEEIIFATFSDSLMRSILKRNTFEAEEIDIFKALYRWSQINHRDITYEKNYIRLAHITRKDFCEILKPTGLFIDHDFTQPSQDLRPKRSLTNTQEELGECHFVAEQKKPTKIRNFKFSQSLRTNKPH
ncbi:hypothetical protein B4U80_11795 [Leptotrombidium deliense]|uniref:BTB domain-containing protein n=1 Tax=Leptotrombidium deliense TaxID=299467 RepID=A0A443S2E1_9ACAR|nr:hypothetical protein B4U80_11795 [Leptotrombidium deliense]